MWLLDTFQNADAHPLIQYGDAIICNPEDILRQYNHLEMPDLLDRLGDMSLRERALSEMTEAGKRGPRERDTALMKHAPAMWDLMVEIATPVLSDPAAICNQVREDRARTIRMSQMTKENKNAGAAPENKTPKPSKYANDTKISMGADKEGKKFGKDNNPKRQGSKSADRFAKYTDGMTVESALKAGLTVADFDNDIKKGFISIG